MNHVIALFRFRPPSPGLGFNNSFGHFVGNKHHLPINLLILTMKQYECSEITMPLFRSVQLKQSMVVMETMSSRSRLYVATRSILCTDRLVMYHACMDYVRTTDLFEFVVLKLSLPQHILEFLTLSQSAINTKASQRGSYWLVAIMSQRQ